MPLTFAKTVDIDHDEKIFSSDRLWEYRGSLPIDEISPDLLADAGRRALDTLLEQSSQRGVALDWSTMRSDVHSVPSTGSLHLTMRVDVL